MTKLGLHVLFSAVGLVSASLVLTAPAMAEGLPVTPAEPESATVIDAPPPCINYPGNIPCNLSTFSASLGIGG